MSKGPEATLKEWTVMIYMSGENNLSIDMAYSIEKIRQSIKSDANMNLFVYFDGAASGVPTLYCDFSDVNSGGCFYNASKLDRILRTCEGDGDENSANIKSIANFVDWCVNRAEYEENGIVERGRKAKRYALIFSGHSSGIFREGFLRDETSGNSLTFRNVRMILNRLTMTEDEWEVYIKEKAEEENQEISTSDQYKNLPLGILGQKFDLLGFDSCLMGMLEVAYQFRRSAKTMIASEGSIPAAGWSYAEILGCLSNSDKEMETNYIAKTIVQSFILNQDRHTLGGVNVDIAAWDLTKFAENTVREALKEFSVALLGCFVKPESSLYKFTRRLLTYVHWRSQSYLFEQNIDLIDFCQLLGEEIASIRAETKYLPDEIIKVEDAAKNLAEQVRSVILVHGFSGGKYQYSNGAALFFPWSLSTFNEAKKEYATLDLSREIGENGWIQFLWKFLSQVTLRPSVEFEDRFVDSGAVYYNQNFGEMASVGAVGKGLTKTEINPKIDKDGLAVNTRTEVDPKVSKGVSIDSGGKIVVKTDINPRVDRTPLNPVLDRSPINPSEKTPINPALDRGLTNKIPDNAATRMFGSTGQMIQSIMEWKNIQTFWDVSGLSELPEAYGDDRENRSLDEGS